MKCIQLTFASSKFPAACWCLNLSSKLLRDLIFLFTQFEGYLVNRVMCRDWNSVKGGKKAKTSKDRSFVLNITSLWKGNTGVLGFFSLSLKIDSSLRSWLWLIQERDCRLFNSVNLVLSLCSMWCMRWGWNNSKQAESICVVSSLRAQS